MQAIKLLAILVAAVPAMALAASSAAMRSDLQMATQARPNLENGSDLFTQCVSCHGGRGGGQDNGNTPRIAGQHYSVLLKQLVDFRHGRRWDFRMEEYANKHHLETPQDIADVAAYVGQLDSGQVRGMGDGIHATDGARIFGARCASCHGASGRGDAAKVVPRLAGQHYAYLVRQMYDAVDGRRPTLQKVHSHKIEPLDFEQVRAVADYLSRIDWDAVQPPGPLMAPPVASEALTGLGAPEARARLAVEGFNELPTEHGRPLWRIALGVMREPMFFLLVAAAVVYALIGDLAEASLLLVFATISVAIAIIQQGRSEKALDALRDLTSPRALVVRDGQRVRIPGREVVRGDVVVLAEGDRVPADAVVIAGSYIEVDESLLTGESIPVAKIASTVLPESLAAPGSGERTGVYGGTLVIRGSGMAVVMATGARSAIGLIGSSLAGLAREQPRLERESRKLVIAFGIGGLTLSVIAMLLYGLLRGSWIEALLGGIALGMALLPEEFPLVLSVFMVMGAWRLSRSRVLTRRAAVIETLGAATVLCTDKTGTLTRNIMSVANLRGGRDRWDSGSPLEGIAESGELRLLLATAALASDDHLVDPMERALAQLQGIVAPDLHRGVLLREYPLRPELLAVTRVWEFANEGGIVVASKGAPEAIAQLCGLDAGARAALHAEVDRLAQDGVRVLGVARAAATDAALPATADGFQFRYLGLVGFADPLRESVPQAVRECRSAGVRVLMITGDYPATARAIATQAGLAEGTTITGAEVAALDDVALAQRVREATLFARITPAQKLRIVNALKANGEVVAMTGDGVNDAPALKAAHIGIAMGGRGTDVAREAASMVLLDDDFGSIVRAIRLGRRIYDNLRKAMGYILAIHVPIAGLALLPVLLGWPLMLTPMLIALLELIIDPACSVVLEAEREESDVMQRPPRRADSTLLSPPLIAWSLVQGLCAFGFVALVFVAAANSVMSENSVRTLSFLALVGANLALIFVNRTFTSSLRDALGRPNRVLWWGLGIVAVVITLILVIPAARVFFDLEPVGGDLLAWVATAALLLLGLLEFAKRHWRRRLET